MQVVVHFFSAAIADRLGYPPAFRELFFKFRGEKEKKNLDGVLKNFCNQVTAGSLATVQNKATVYSDCKMTFSCRKALTVLDQ